MSLPNIVWSNMVDPTMAMMKAMIALKASIENVFSLVNMI
jgi:hypothetical protein